MKKTKITKYVTIGLGLTVIAAATTISAVSCAANTNNNDTNGTILNNENKDFTKSQAGSTGGINLTNADMLNKFFSTTSGIKSLKDVYANKILYNWFKNSNNPLIQSKFKEFEKQANESYDNEYESYSKRSGNWNQDFQAEVLDPSGGSKQSYIYKKVVSNLKDSFVTQVFSNFVDNFLTLKVGGKNELVKDGIQDSVLNDPNNINGASGAGTRNNFEFALPSTSKPDSIDAGYVNFINFAFDQWIKNTMPILTPSILFKSEAKPNTSGLFNKDFFGESLTEEASYNFQWFAPASTDQQTLSTTDLYKIFKQGADSYINNETGAINFPSGDGSVKLTQDSSYDLITNVSDGWDKYVAPYTAAVMYKLNQGIFGNATTTDVPSTTTGTLAETIMGNFLVTGTASATGEFKFPYSTTRGSLSAFSGEYANIAGVKDTVDLSNSPYIMTRDEFGVHIIGIDRYSKIKAAATAGTTSQDKIKNVDNELANTILWRQAQKINSINPTTNSVDINQAVTDYVNSNFSTLIIEYLSPQNASNANNLFTSDKWTTQPEAINNDLGLVFNNFKKIEDLRKAKEYINTVKTKILANQSKLTANNEPDTWYKNGIAGVLPYKRNTVSGNYNSLDELVVKGYGLKIETAGQPSLSQQIDSKISTFETALNAAMHKYLSLVQPATKAFWENQTRTGSSTYVFTSDSLINSAIQLGQTNDSTLTNIVTNYQEWDSLKPFLTGLEKAAKLSVAPTPTTDLIYYYLAKAIKNNYFTFNFSSEANKFANGNWTDLNSLKTELQNNKIESWKNSISTNKNFSNFNLSDLKTFLTSLSWLVGFDSKKSNFSFDNLVSQLNEMVQFDKTAYVAWNFESTIKNQTANDKFGITGANTQNSINTSILKDGEFKSNPVYLNGVNPYSYQGATNPFDNKTNISYTTLTHYWNTSTMNIGGTTKELTGFLGFQSSNNSNTNNQLPSSAYDSSIFGNNVSNTDNLNWKGALYQYGSKTKFTEQINKINSVSELTNFVQIVKNCKFNFNATELENLEKAQTGQNTVDGIVNSLTFEERKAAFTSVINSIPNQAFEPLRGSYLWNNQNGTSTTLFDGTGALRKEYVVSQFSKNDVDALLTKPTTNKATGTTTLPTLNTSTTGSYLGLPAETFFNAIVLLAMNSNIQKLATDAMVKFREESINKITVYDARIANALGEKFVHNWNDFKKDE